MSERSLPGPEAVAACMLADRHRFRRRLKGLSRMRPDDPARIEGIERLRRQMADSAALAERRRQAPLSLSFPPELPISQRWEEIAELIRAHQVIVLCGETGSGKSTQLPKVCLALERGVFGRIGHTQPRRIAARALAGRIAAELGCEPGTTVGHKVRFHDHVRPETRVKLLTDGMLLAEIQRDRYLNEYDTLIVDEAHERSLNIDFLLGYLRQLLPKRPDLKLIVTSATIDPERFSEHFGGAPIVNVSGRTWPVEVRYRPPAEEGGGERDEPLQQAILDAVDELSRIDRGDILVFLSGEREIRETAESLRKHRLQLTEVLPLYARLGPAEQGRIFNPGGQRRIVLATNVAETSLTVPGIRYVIDAGYARISRYSHRSKVQRLPVERISRASADQRKGRCGRLAEGVCIRLYSEEEYLSRPEFTEPEILRTNLASVILQMKLLGFGDIETFPFVDPPDRRLVKDGYRILEEIGAVTRDRKVTRLGRQLARLPVDPRIGRMLLEAAHTHCLDEVLVIAAALSVQDPRDRPMEKREAADAAHGEFRHEQSDFLTLLNLWRELERQRRHLSRRKFQRWCRDRFLSWTRVQEWRDIHHQLRGQLHEMGYRENQAEAGYEEIHKALLSGLLSHVGFRPSGKEKEYQGGRNSRFLIFPGSGLYQKQPKWVVAAELVETTRLYARNVALVRPEWIESLAGHLVKHSYSEPHWERKRGQVAAYERVTLFGLTLVPRRKINFGPIDPVQAREIFIRSALVERDFHSRAPFWRHNLELIEYLEGLERKARRRDLLVDEERIYAFYDQRVPEGIYSAPQFEKWLRRASRNQPKLLHMRLEELTRPEAATLPEGAFPDTFDVNGTPLPLRYHFEPGQPADGVTLRIPLGILNQVSEERCQWLVPGLLKERVVALLRGLPKSLRRAFVPIPDYADACLAAMTPGERPLVQALGEQLKAMTGVHVPEDAWDESRLPEHLRMRFELLDDDGRRIAVGRDLADLKRRHGGKGEGGFRGLADPALEREGLRDWEVGVLPGTVALERGGIRLQGYPALVDEGDSAALRILDSEAAAEGAHRGGVRRLLMLRLSREMRYLKKNLPGMQPLRLIYASLPKPPEGLAPPPQKDLEPELVALILDLTFLDGRPPIRDREAFDGRIEACRGELMTRAGEALELVKGILERYQQVRRRLGGITQIRWMASVADVREQLDRLLYHGFLRHTPWPRLRHFPRYLEAVALRLEKLEHAAARDQKLLREMQGGWRRWQQWDDKVRRSGRPDPRIDELRWLFEELRVSLFAQQLGTDGPVSLKRIEKRWKELGL